MRIAIFSEVYWPMVSGVSHALQQLVGAMTVRGHACRVYAPAYTLPDDSQDRPTVFRSPAQPFFLYRDVNWAFPRRGELSADVARFRPDVVHVATEFAMGLAGLRSARQLGIPVVASAHTDYEKYATKYRLDWAIPGGWRYLRWFYGQAARVLCPSHNYQRHLTSRGVRHTGVWSRGVDLVKFSPARRSAAFRTLFNIPADASIVLCVGRLAVEKNLHLLLDAWRQIYTDELPARLVLVGTGPMAGDLIAAANRGVVLTGVLTGDALSEAYASADLFAFPSSTETFGNVLLEAMASGLPALAVSAGGVLDFAEHDRSAWLVSPDSASALAAGLKCLLGDASLRVRLAAGGLQVAAARDWAGVFDAVEGYYTEAIGMGGLRRAA